MDKESNVLQMPVNGQETGFTGVKPAEQADNTVKPQESVEEPIKPASDDIIDFHIRVYTDRVPYRFEWISRPGNPLQAFILQALFDLFKANNATAFAPYGSGLVVTPAQVSTMKQGITGNKGFFNKKFK